MQYRQLGSDGPQVSLIGLGTMTWGEQNTLEEACAQLDLATDYGVTLIDAAEMYPVPPRAETQGRTEEYLGQWLKRRGRHDDLVIATKVTGRSDGFPWIRNGPRLDAGHVTRACEASLQRLGVDCIDLYQVHWPERQTNFFGKLGYTDAPDNDAVPIESTLRALDQLLRDGKIRHIGISNETPWGLAEYLRLAATEGFPVVASVQNPYNLLNRSYEVGMAEFASRSDVGLLAYSPLAFGVLSGKYLDGAKPAGGRLTLYERFSRYTHAEAQTATEKYVALAKEHDLSPTQMALTFVNSRPFVRSNLIGATTLEQLRENLESVEITLPEAVLDGISAIHRTHSNPAP